MYLDDTLQRITSMFTNSLSECDLICSCNLCVYGYVCMMMFKCVSFIFCMLVLVVDCCRRVWRGALMWVYSDSCRCACGRACIYKSCGMRVCGCLCVTTTNCAVRRQRSADGAAATATAVRFRASRGCRVLSCRALPRDPITLETGNFSLSLRANTKFTHHVCTLVPTGPRLKLP